MGPHSLLWTSDFIGDISQGRLSIENPARQYKNLKRTVMTRRGNKMGEREPQCQKTVWSGIRAFLTRFFWLLTDPIVI